MAIGGTVSKPIFVKDGQYLSLTAEAAITLGNFVKMGTTSALCNVCGADEDALGVAVGGNRFSRTSTDNVIAAGQKVTICTRGIVNVYTDTSAILVGSYITTGTSGVAQLGAKTDFTTAQAIALEANASAAATIMVKLMRG